MSAFNTGLLIGIFLWVAFLGHTNKKHHEKTRERIAVTCTSETQQALIDAAFIEGKIQGVRDVEKVMNEILESAE